MDISGFVALGIVALFLVYLVPQLIRSRQDLVDSRVGDRFSADLRILATAGPDASAPTAAPAPTGRAYLHAPRPRTEESAMDRPLAHVSRLSAPVGTNPARSGTGAPRGAVAARRRAAARRRLALTLALLAVTAAGWSAYALGLVAVLAAVVPTALLALVLVLGRRAARASSRPAGSAVPRAHAPAGRVSGARSSTERATEPPAGRVATGRTPERAPGRASAERAPESVGARRSTPTPESVAAHAARQAAREASTEILPRAVAHAAVTASPGLTWRGEPTSPVLAAGADDGATTPATRRGQLPGRPASIPPSATQPGAQDAVRGWVPVPVPVPTYTMKPAAPRMSAAPLDLGEPTPDAAAPPAAPAMTDVPDPRPVAALQPGSDAPGVSEPGPGLDLDAVLSRRRAAGE